MLEFECPGAGGSIPVASGGMYVAGIVDYEAALEGW
jgi:hypothetical protein